MWCFHVATSAFGITIASASHYDSRGHDYMAQINFKHFFIKKISRKMIFSLLVIYRGIDSE